MASSLLSLFIFSLFLLHQSLSTTSTIPKSTLFKSKLIFQPTPSTDSPLTPYFEVTKPIQLPPTKPCSYLLLHHDFGYTYGNPPVLADYTPPSNCPSQNFAKIVLEWNATCKGRQFDRIFGVWLGGVELLRSCTAEPRSTGIIWTVQKDISSSRRSISSIGWVKSSHGNITTNSTQAFNFRNFMVMGKDGNLQIVNQIIDFNDSVHALMPTSNHSIESFKRFPLYLYSEAVDQGNDTYNFVTNLSLGFDEERVKGAGFGFLVSSLHNLQNAQGIMLLEGNLVVSGIGSTQQAYRYNGSKFCYFRTVTSSNYSILYDKAGNTCSERIRPRVGFGLAKRLRFPARRASLTSVFRVNKNWH